MTHFRSENIVDRLFSHLHVCVTATCMLPITCGCYSYICGVSGTLDPGVMKVGF